MLQAKAIRPFLLPALFFGILSLINLIIGVRILHDPAPFPASIWDLRWAIFFAVAFLAIAVFYLTSQFKALIIFSLIGAVFLAVTPIITIGAGAAFLMLLLIILVARGAGEWMLQVLLGSPVQNRSERLILSILLGLGGVMLLVMVQGFLHAFTPLVTWIGFATLLVVFVLPNLKKWYLELKAIVFSIPKLWSGKGLSGWAVVFGILVILWLPSWLISLAPANRYDEMTYHLTAPLLYLRDGGIVPYPQGGTTVWMHYAEMLYTLALQTAGQPLPRLLHLSMGVISAALVFLFGKRLANTAVGVIGAILFFAVPAVGYETSTAYIDLFVTAYTTAFGFALYHWWIDRNSRWLLVAGVLGGFGLGIKLTAGPIIGGLMAIFILATLIEHHLTKMIAWIGIMAALVVLLALPWLIRDGLWTGDPFYPYGYMFAQKISASSPIPGGEPASSLNLQSKLANFITYPSDLVFKSILYYHEAPGGMASTLPLLALPIFVLSPSLSRKAKFTGLALLAGSILTVGVMLIANNALLRYALPIFPLLAICAALNVGGLFQWLSTGSRNWVGVGILMIGLLYLFSTRLPLVTRNFDDLPQRFPVNYFLGRETRQAYLSRTLIVYDAFQFIDSQPGGPHRVLSIGNEFRLYTSSRIDGIYDVTGTSEIVAKAQTPAELARQLAEMGYDYILVNQPEAEFRPWKYIDPYPILYQTNFYDLYGELLFAKNGIYVYRFHPEGANLPPPKNLLTNSGFEDIDGQNNLSGWQEFGSVEISKDAFEGNSSVYLYAPLSTKGAGDVHQRVPVDGNALYTLGYWLRADQDAVFLMRIIWLDENGNTISTEEQWINIDQTWKWYSIHCSSPQGARYAEIHASLGGSQNAWVDQVCFARGQSCPDK